MKYKIFSLLFCFIRHRIGRSGSCFAILFLGLCMAAWGSNRYVEPNHSNAKDEGSGNAENPYRTLSYAVKVLLPGDTLHIASGIYRDALIFPNRQWSFSTPTTILGIGDVTVLGTDVVTGWTSVGGEKYIRGEWKSEPQQVMVLGRPLKQVGGTIFGGYPEQPKHELIGLHKSEGGIWPGRQAISKQTLPPESFYYDAALQQLVIRTKTRLTSGNEVEVAIRPFLVLAKDIEGLTLKNIRFRYSTTSTISRQGAVTLSGNGNTLQNIIVEDVDGTGIHIEGNKNRIIGSTVTRSGHLGIKARGRHNQISFNRVTYNNTRRFNKWWEAGGMKFIGNGGLQESEVSENEVSHNYGDGIWFDWGNRTNRIEKNTVAYNEGFGIHYEASSSGKIVGNVVFGNLQRGIYLPHSHSSLVTGNIVVANGLDGVVIIDEQRRDETGQENLIPNNNEINNNLIAWNKGMAVILPGAAYGNSSDKNLYITEDGSPRFSMNWPKTWFDKSSLSQWRRKEGQDLKSLSLTISMDKRIKDSLDRHDVKINWAPLILLAQKQNTFQPPMIFKIDVPK